MVKFLPNKGRKMFQPSLLKFTQIITNNVSRLAVIVIYIERSSTTLVMRPVA